ncbi:MAG TPA: enoyl-CoA-hydratase DpgB [Pseudonocardiaceae bacterium]|nr:enoyl-CoA-hydratase DpgB [Pseudonocardiaceae bacterium]
MTENVTKTGPKTPGPAGRVVELDGGRGYRLLIDGAVPLSGLTASLNGLCDAAEDRPDPTIVVLALGTTLPEHRSWPTGVAIQDVNRWERAVRRLELLNCVSIALVPETCGGPALDLLLACDYRIGTAHTRLLLPVNDGQFWPGMGLYRLAHHIGLGRARRLVLWGHEVDVSQALELGLVDEAAASAQGAAAAAAVLFGRIAGADLAVRRRLLLEAPQAAFDDALGVHLAACDRELRRLRADG